MIQIIEVNTLLWFDDSGLVLRTNVPLSITEGPESSNHNSNVLISIN